MDQFVPEMMREEEIKAEEEDATSTIVSCSSLAPQHQTLAWIEDRSQLGEKPEEVKMEVKEEDEIKIEEEEVPPPDDSLAPYQQGPSWEEGKSEIRAKSDKDIRKILIRTCKTDGDSHSGVQVVSKARKEINNLGDTTSGSNNLKVAHPTKDFLIFVDAPAELLPKSSSSEYSTQPYKRQKVTPKAKQDLGTPKPEIMKMISRGSLKTRDGKIPMVIKVRLAPPRMEDGKKIITVFPSEVIRLSTKCIDDPKDPRRHAIDSIAEITEDAGNNTAGTVQLLEKPSVSSSRPLQSDSSQKVKQKKDNTNSAAQHTLEKHTPALEVCTRKDAGAVPISTVQAQPKQKNRRTRKYPFDYYESLLALQTKQYEWQMELLAKQEMIRKVQMERFKIMRETSKIATETSEIATETFSSMTRAIQSLNDMLKN